MMPLFQSLIARSSLVRRRSCNRAGHRGHSLPGSLPRMEPKKTWDGYRSFSYLVEGEDYRSFELAARARPRRADVVPLGRRGRGARRPAAARVGLHLAARARRHRARRLGRQRRVHPARPRVVRVRGPGGHRASTPSSRTSSTAPATITSAGGWKWTDVIARPRACTWPTSRTARRCSSATSVADIERAHETGRIALGRLDRGRGADRERARPDRRPLRPRRADARRHVQRVQPARAAACAIPATVASPTFGRAGGHAG